MTPVTELTKKAARHELRKAQTLDLLAVITQSQEAHGKNMETLRLALAEHTVHQMRLSSSLWARLKWLAVGR
jgi:hypothetical protein